MVWFIDAVSVVLIFFSVFLGYFLGSFKRCFRGAISRGDFPLFLLFVFTGDGGGEVSKEMFIIRGASAFLRFPSWLMKQELELRIPGWWGTFLKVSDSLVFVSLF